MAYDTRLYLIIFLPAVLLLYQLTPRNKRHITLLLSSYLFFWTISRWLVLYLIGTTVFVLGISRRIASLKQRCRQQTDGMDRKEAAPVRQAFARKEKHVLTAGIVILLAVLAYVKYYNFFAENVNSLACALLGQTKGPLPIRRILIPIGISFYTLEAIGYLVDVYWDKVSGSEPWGKVALFLSFFPQTMEGPIALYQQTADDLWAGRPLNLRNLSDGAVRIFWGLFKKWLIADRLYVLVSELFNHYEDYSGAYILVAAVAYTVQLYMEFSGCMDIIIGSGRMFGITLPENFNQPFVSRSASEFWRRWHISLGIWFRTYIFYPVSASGPVKKWNKYSRKKYGKYIAKLGVSAMALLPVWLCNGLWHGASWNYIFYGVYYFVILLAETAMEPVRDRLQILLHAQHDPWYWKTLQILKTWIIIFTGELFFRAYGLKAGFSMFASLFHHFDLRILFNGSLLTYQLDRGDYLIIIMGCLITAIIGSIKERKLLGDQHFGDLPKPVRWALSYALILAVIIFGAYGIGYQQVDLIYAGF